MVKLSFNIPHIIREIFDFLHHVDVEKMTFDEQKFINTLEVFSAIKANSSLCTEAHV